MNCAFITIGVTRLPTDDYVHCIIYATIRLLKLARGLNKHADQISN